MVLLDDGNTLGQVCGAPTAASDDLEIVKGYRTIFRKGTTSSSNLPDGCANNSHKHTHNRESSANQRYACKCRPRVFAYSIAAGNHVGATLDRCLLLVTCPLRAAGPSGSGYEYRKSRRTAAGQCSRSQHGRLLDCAEVLESYCLSLL